MKVKIELFGAARDFSEKNLLELDLEQKKTQTHRMLVLCCGSFLTMKQ